MNSVISILKEESGRVRVSFSYNPVFVEKIKLIKGHQLLGHAHSKTTEIYTHVCTKSLGNITSPLDTLSLTKGGND